MLARQVLYHWSHSTSPFFVCVLGIFEIGSLKLFAYTGLEQWTGSVAQVVRHLLSFSCCGGTVVWTQEFALAKQTFYCLSYTFSTFCSGSFGDVVS
jgi:hypothetical protein